VHSALSWLNCSALTGSGRCCQVGMAGAAESFGAGRGSGTEPDGKGAASPSEAPSEAQAASTKPPNRIATNPRICPDMFPTDQYDAGMLYRKAPHIVDLQQRKNTARISWSHKIERLWQFNHRYFWRMTSSKYTLGDARMTPRRLCCFESTFSRRDYCSVRQLAPQATTARSGERTCNVGSRATRKRHRR